MTEIAVLSACAAGGLPQTAPEGLVPLDSHSSPAGGTKKSAAANLFLHVRIMIICGYLKERNDWLAEAGYYRVGYDCAGGAPAAGGLWLACSRHLQYAAFGRAW